MDMCTNKVMPLTIAVLADAVCGQRPCGECLPLLKLALIEHISELQSLLWKGLVLSQIAD